MGLREASEKLEKYVVEIIDGRGPVNNIDKYFTAFLFVMSRIYRSVVQLRLTLYNERIIRQQMLGCLVISIGNLTCGGTGKTPVVEVFARTLTERGRKVAILSRGYRRKSKPFLQKLKDIFKKDENVPPGIVSDGNDVLMDSTYAGDEPFMLATNLPGVIVLVDKDRVKAGKYAVQKMGADTLILDDGYQYLRLKPRFNICLIDTTSPFHNHNPLPRGLLREPIKNVRRADYVFLTKCKEKRRLNHLKKFITHHNPKAEIIECTHRSRYFQDLTTGEQVPLAEVQGRKIAAISGIAVPAGFEKYLEDLGGNLVHKEWFVDHHRYSDKEIQNFIDESVSNNAEWIITTEKDAVRFSVPENCPLKILFLRVDIDILSGEENFNECISRICL